MTELSKKYPFCFVSGIFILTVFFSYPIGRVTKLLTALSAALIFIFCAIKHFKRSPCGLQMLVSGSIAAAMLFSFLYFNCYIDGFEKYDARTAKIEATVLERLSLTVYSSSYIIDISSIDGESCNIKTIIDTEYPLDLDEGDIFTVRAAFKSIEENINGFAKRRYEISRGIYIYCGSEDENSFDYISGSDSPRFILRRFREAINNRLDVLFGDNSGFAKALFTGDRSTLQNSIRRDSSRTGISHMLAISGLHLTVIVGAAMMLIKKIGLGRRISGIFGIAVCLFYMSLAGFSGSVTRAGIMLIIGIAAALIRISGSRVNYLFIAMTLICLVRPDSFCDIGLMLSFLSVLGIVSIVPPIQNRLRQRLDAAKPSRRIFIRAACALSVTLAAVLFTLPIVWLYFGQLSIISPLTNLIFTVPMTLIIVMIPLTLLLSYVPVISALFITTANGVIALTLTGIEKLAMFPGLLISLRFPFVKWIAAAMAIGLLIIIMAHLPPLKACTVLCCSAAVTFAICTVVFNLISFYENTMYYANIGKNDTLVIKSENKIIICDMTDGGYSSASTDMYIASDLLYSCDIDTYMLTHYHKKNISSAIRLINNYYIRNLLLPIPDSEEDEGIFNAILDAADENGCGVVVYKRGCNIEYASVVIRTAAHTFIGRSTHPVIAMCIESGESSVLYCGASAYDSAALRRWISPYQQSCEIAIFGEHGPILKYSPLLTENWPDLSYAVYADDKTYCIMKAAVSDTSDARLPYKNMIEIKF